MVEEGGIFYKINFRDKRIRLRRKYRQISPSLKYDRENHLKNPQNTNCKTQKKGTIILKLRPLCYYRTALMAEIQKGTTTQNTI